MSTVLPRPTVTVTESSSPDGTTKEIVIHAARDNKDTKWSGTGATTLEATRGALEKMLNDPITGEYLP